MDENSYIYCQFGQLGLRCFFHRAGGNLVAVLVEGVVLVHHAAIVARTLLLLRDRPYFIRLDDTDVVEQPVVLVVVGNDDAVFLFLRQHELYIILNVASVLDEGSVDVAVGEVDECHRSEYQVWKLFLFLLSKRVRPAGGPEVHEVIYELTACQSVLLQEQFDHTLALLLDLLVSFTHNYVV